MENIFQERLQKAMKEKDVKAADLCHATGFSSALISQYMTGKIKPRNDKAYVIAKYLGVDPGWLMGWKDDKDVNDDNNKEEERMILVAYRKASPEIQKAIKLMLGIEK